MNEEGEIVELKIPSGNRDERKPRVGQEQIHGLLFSEQLSWQAIIYDLINTEQLDPWDIDLVLLSSKYLERIRELEEANLFISSKVLFAASLLLRIKSEILLNHYIPSLDEILFGKKEEKRYIQERIELEGEIPELVQRTPLPRARKVSLEELMAALGKAVKTENRRIQKTVLMKQQEIETAIALPRRQINLTEKIKEVYGKLKNIFSNREERISFSEVAGEDADEKIAHFVPLLHLDTQHKVLLEQEEHLKEIWIWLKEHHEKKNFDILLQKRKEVEEAFAMLEKEQYEEDKKMEEERNRNLKKGRKFGKKKGTEIEEVESFDDEIGESVKKISGNEAEGMADVKNLEDANRQAITEMFG